MRINKNVWEKFVVLNTPRLLGPPGLPVILSQSPPILLAFNAPLISGYLGFLKVMSYDYVHCLMLMMWKWFHVSFHMHVYFDTMFIYFLYSHHIVYLLDPTAIRLSRSIWNCIRLGDQTRSDRWRRWLGRWTTQSRTHRGRSSAEKVVGTCRGRCSKGSSGARGIGEQKVPQWFLSQTRKKGIYYWIERREMMLRFSLQFTNFLWNESLPTRKMPLGFCWHQNRLSIPKDKKKVFRTKTVDFGSTTLSKHLHQFSLPVPWQFSAGSLGSFPLEVETSMPNAPIVWTVGYIACKNVSCKFSEYSTSINKY